jgi:hypothetical protein
MRETASWIGWRGPRGHVILWTTSYMRACHDDTKPPSIPPCFSRDPRTRARVPCSEDEKNLSRTREKNNNNGSSDGLLILVVPTRGTIPLKISRSRGDAKPVRETLAPSASLSSPIWTPDERSREKKSKKHNHQIRCAPGAPGLWRVNCQSPPLPFPCASRVRR